MQLLNPATVFILVLLLCACKAGNSKAEVEAAMQHYDRLIEKMDADSVALLYTPDGQLGTMAHGRDSIRLFLNFIKNVHVLSNHSDTKLFEASGDKATQQGTYKQVAIVNSKDTITSTGRYRADWIRLSEGWRIQRMSTFPDKRRL